MSKQVIFRDRQEVQSTDLNNAQIYVRDLVDQVVREGLTDDLRYTGFTATNTATTKVEIDVGAFWENGIVYIREATHEIDFLSALPLTTKKIAAIVTDGSEIETDIQARDYLVNVSTGATEPDNVAMQKLRYADLSVNYGTENATPQKPTVAVDKLVVAWVTLDQNGVVSIEQNSAGRLVSTKALDARAAALEAWRKAAGERIDTLGSDISALAVRLSNLAGLEDMEGVLTDLADIKETLDLEDNYSDYGADHFLTEDESDTDHVNYSALVEEGFRFPWVAIDETALELFNPLDDKVEVSSGFAIPKHDELVRIAVDEFLEQHSISQYQFQTVDWKLVKKSRKRLRFGQAFSICRNNRWWKSGKFDAAQGIFKIGGETYQTLTADFSTRFRKAGRPGFGSAKHIRLQKFWYDEEEDHYNQRLVTDFQTNASLVAQTFLNTQDGWLTSIDLAFTQADSNGDVTVNVCRVKDGKPNLTEVIATATLAVEDIVVGTDFKTDAEWTNVPLPPTFLRNGDQFAIVLLTGGDHYVGLSSGSEYAQGTFFQSTDGQFLMGDLEKDMMFRAKFAKFSYNRVEVDLKSLSLSGGIDGIDITAETIVPEGCELIFEVRPDGTNNWTPLNQVDSDPFSGLPPLVHFRAVFIGTKDVAAGLSFTTSRVRVQRPDTSLTHISEQITLASTTQSLKVKVILDQYYETNHDLTCTIDDVTNASNGIAPATTTDTELEDHDGNHKRIERVFEWTATEIPVALQDFVINFSGTTTSAQDLYHGEKRVHLAF